MKGMVFTKIALAAGFLLLGFLIWLAIMGMTAVGEALVTLFALVLLVGGGNWISGRSPYGRRTAEVEPRPISQRYAAAPQPPQTGDQQPPSSTAGTARAPQEKDA